jgi:heptosyltransferase-2/heptosyltransferase-3
LLGALVPNLEAALGPTRYLVSEADRAWAATRLEVWAQERGDPATPRVAIHAGAGALVKQWSLENWAEVADALHSRAGAAIVLTGGPGEGWLTAGIAARMRGASLDLSGQTSFGQLAALYSRCDLVLGSDSGPLHLAVAAGAKTIHLYGPVPAAKFGPWGDPARNVVLNSPFLCAPCDRLDWSPAALRLHPCVAAIRPQDVIHAALRLIRSEL